jgi:hypothetical protein
MDTTRERNTYGLMAEFADADGLVAAIQAVRAAGYEQFDAYSPLPVHEILEATGEHRSPIPLMVLTGGIVGCLTGFGMQAFASAVHYPLNVGGRPFLSWPAFMPITFECTILFAAFAAVFGMLAINKLPMPWHPVFNVEGFERASQDRFFLCVKATDPHYEPETLTAVLKGCRPLSLQEVRP